MPGPGLRLRCVAARVPQGPGFITRGGAARRRIDLTRRRGDAEFFHLYLSFFMEPIKTTTKQQDAPADLPSGFQSAEELLQTLWPNEKSRPSLRWLRGLTAKKAVPFIKIGHKVWFEPARVAAALRRYEIPAS